MTKAVPNEGNNGDEGDDEASIDVDIRFEYDAGDETGAPPSESSAREADRPTPTVEPADMAFVRPALEAEFRPTPTVELADPTLPTRIPSDMEGILRSAFGDPIALRGSLNPPPAIMEYSRGESLPPGATIAKSGESHDPMEAVIADVVDGYLEITGETKSVFELINEDPMFEKVRDLIYLLKDVGIDLNDVLVSIDIYRLNDANLTRDEIFNICLLFLGDLARTVLFELGVRSVSADVVPDLASLSLRLVAKLDESHEIDNPFLRVNLTGIVGICNRYAEKIGIDQNTIVSYKRFLQGLSIT